MAATALSPRRTVVTSFTPRKPLAPNGESVFDDGDWILCMAASPRTDPTPSIACALSNGDVQLYDQERLHTVSTFSKVHGNSTITDLIYGPSHSLLTAGHDGNLAIADLRQSAGPSMRARLPSGQFALSVSVGFDGYLAAAASNKARIHFFDLRMGGNLLGSYVDSHTDAVTQAVFLEGSSMLLTGAEDGLVCCFDTSQPTEEYALKSVLNVGTPVRHVGFCGPRYESVYCLTGSETASLWDWEAATCIRDFGFHLRDDLRKAAGDNCMDYLIDAHWDTARQELLLGAGSSTGDAGLFRLSANHQNQQSSQNTFECCHVMRGGHRAVIRAWSQLSEFVYVTSGEDARLCEWDRRGLQHSTGIAQSNTAIPAHCGRGKRDVSSTYAGGGGPLRRQRQKQGSAPY